MKENTNTSKSLRKGIMLLAVYMIMSITIGYAQYSAEGWQWMKEFQGVENRNKRYNTIKQVVMDSVGNYYILGTAGENAEIDGVDITTNLPWEDPYLEACTFLAKIDGYTGSLLWHKTVKEYGRDYSSFSSSILHKDGKIYFKTIIDIPHYRTIDHQYDPGYFYYLDTAYYLKNHINNPYPFNQECYRRFDAFVTFDLDGNKIDEHFSYLMLRDSAAIERGVLEDYGSDVSPMSFLTNSLSGKLSHIDDNGNIYIYMQGCYLYDLVYEEFDIETDTTLPFKIYVDDTIVYEFKTQEYWGTQTCGNSVDNIFLWKFSPELKPLWPEPKPLIKYVDSCSNGFSIFHTMSKLLFLDESSTDHDDYMYFHWIPYGTANEDEQTYPMYVYFDSVNRIKIENRYDLTYTLNAIIKVDTAGNIEWVDKGKYCIPNSGKRCGSSESPSEYMTDSIIYVILNADASSVDNTVYLDEEHRYQVPKCYDLTDNNSDFRIYKKISRRTGEYLGSGTICPKGTSRSERVSMMDLFEVNDTLYGFASYIKNDYENTGALSSELVHWDKDNNFLDALDTIATFSETKEPFVPYVYAKGDGRVLVYGNWTVMYSQAPIYFNDTVHLHFTPVSKGYYGMLYDSMFIQRAVVENDDTIGISRPVMSEAEVKIYPNPAVSYIYVELSDNITYLKAELWNANGTLLQTTTERVLNLQTLAPGTYYIRVYTPEGIGVRKVIKM